MSEISPESAGLVPSAPPVTKKPRGMRWAAVTVFILGLLAFGTWSLWPEPKPTSDAFLFNWQVLVDEATAAEIQKQFAAVEMVDNLPSGVEATDSLRRWRMERDRLKSSSNPASAPGCFRGSGDLLRRIVSEASRKQPLSTSRDLHWKQVLSQAPLGDPRKRKLIDRVVHWSDRPSSKEQGIFISGCIDNENNPELPANTNLTASGLYALTLGSQNRIRLHLYGGQVRYTTHATSGDKFQNIPFGWNEWLQSGDAIAIINRFDDLGKTPVLITVCERHDLPPSESLELIGSKLNTPRRWIDGGPAFVSQTIRKINRFIATASPQPNPLPAPWTQQLPDGTQVSLLALSQPEKYPRTFWSPAGTPVTLAREIRDHLITTYRSRNSLLGIVFVTYPVRKVDHLTPIDFTRIIPYSTRYVNNVGLLWNNSWNQGIYNDSAVEVQFGSIPVRPSQDSSEQRIDLALGYGEWQTLGTARFTKPARLAEREITIGAGVPTFSNRRMISVAADWKLLADEESSLVAICKDGRHVLHCFPPPIHVPAADGVLRHRRHHEVFYDIKPQEIDRFEVRVRPTKTIRFSGFVTEPDSLKSSL